MKNISIFLVFSTLVGCKGIQYIPIESDLQFKLEKVKSELVKTNMEKETGRMQWDKKNKNDTAECVFGDKQFCFKYTVRP